MRTVLSRIALAGVCLLVGACATPRPLPKFQKPIERAQVQRVRTTAYTHTEVDHIVYGRQCALGTSLSCDGVRSAAADWSRWPAGTLFRIRETGELYRVDDYGWALSGTNTIDLYKPSRSAMNDWGVRRVTIENLEWGNPRRSLTILKSRARFRHIRRMVDEYEKYGMRFPTLPPLDPLVLCPMPKTPVRTVAAPPRKLMPRTSAPPMRITR